MTWRDTLLAVGDFAPEVQADLQRLIQLVDELLAGHVDLEALRELLGEDPKRITAMLDQLGRVRAPDDKGGVLEPLWDALRGLPDLLRELERVSRGGTPRIEGHGSIRGALARIESRPPVWQAQGIYRCPRCLSGPVYARRESDGFGTKLLEFGCDRCGFNDDMLSDDPRQSEWSNPAAPR